MKNCLCEKKLKLRKDNFSGIPTMTITYIYFQKANRWINVDLRLEHAFCRMTRQIEYAGRRLLAHQVLSRREAHFNSIHLSMVLFFPLTVCVSSLLLRLHINDVHVELGGIMFRAWVHMDWCYNHNMITCKTSVGLNCILHNNITYYSFIVRITCYYCMMRFQGNTQKYCSKRLLKGCRLTSTKMYPFSIIIYI